MPHKRKKTDGFTLIELLVVIAIIGLLSSVVLASLSTARIKARDARRMADLKQIQIALELYYDSNNTYPGEAGWCDSSKGVTARDCSGFGSDSWSSGGIFDIETQDFINLPIDPINSSDYFYAYEPVCGQTQFGVTCEVGSCCAYLLGTVLENSNEPRCMFPSIPQNHCVGGGGAE